ncbi:MBOAT-domain-containing protein [Basidiobolus meristosporus CBS 931.73]|uniref:MBOAT-domain-containing protein n=1 Tax=Basidiobolus meristosporus CBS 931.73 TaxID=1314790 RepID=A0A1Y1YM18_9FUNG|nr:MBOAT-domain-containing protein [Basidiobolus meristosporus CBS 931.73]|eukprot:ORX99060.1 MBOAT-domain-containing protein [Basidiobolus meristosporus CBS 931.73]
MTLRENIHYTQLNVQEATSKKPDQLPPSPSRWRTKEFYCYYLLYLIVIPYILKVAYNISSESHPNYYLYAGNLSEGWLFGRRVDNSDGQFASFRNNYQLIAGCMGFYLLCSKGIRYLNRTLVASTQSLFLKVSFSLVFSVVFIGFVYGANIIKIMLLVTVNYFIAKSCGRNRVSPFLTWLFNIVVLFANERYHGYKFAMLSESLAFLDQYSGVFRWYILFNITTLRMISFNMDYYWSFTNRKRVSESAEHSYTDERDRIETSHLPNDYNYLYYLTYIFYTPLYLAGPIITFNNFLSQLRVPCKTITLKSTLMYGLRVLGAVILMEVMLHCFYVVAISRAKAWAGYTPLEMSMVGYLNLKLIWLKLLIIWRFFRFWAMADGIEVTENMLRCMSNNYSALGFWRSWHRSYNRWLIRYVYVPLGGSKYQAYNMWFVFTFVALWHDISMKLLAWAWLICLFILPELICTASFAKPKYQSKPWYRHVAGVGGVANIIMMMIANLVGFAVGLDGVQEMLAGVFNVDGIFFLFMTFLSLYATVQLMFEVREHERRKHGKYLSY